MKTTTHYRLAIIDLDDTLLDEKKQVGPDNLQALRLLQAAGIELVIASGRHHANITRVAIAIDFQGWVISAQGARAQHMKTNEVIYQQLIPKDLALEVYDRGHREGVSLLAYHPTGPYIESDTEWTRLHTARAGVVPKMMNLRELAADGLEKLMWSTAPDRIDRFQSVLEAEYQDRLYVVATELEVLDFCSPKATKALAAQAVTEKLGVRREEVVAFGDGNNDVPLLQWAGLSIAMDHGRASARRAAKLVTPPGPHESAFARGVTMVLG